MRKLTVADYFLPVTLFVTFFIAVPILLLTINWEFTKVNDQILSKSTYNFYDYKGNCTRSTRNDQRCLVIFHDDSIYANKSCGASRHPYQDYDSNLITTCKYQYTGRSEYTTDIGAHWEYSCKAGTRCTDVITKITKQMCTGTDEQIYKCRDDYYNSFVSVPMWCDYLGCNYNVGISLWQIIPAILLIIMGTVIFIKCVCKKQNNEQESDRQSIMVIGEQTSFV